MKKLPVFKISLVLLGVSVLFFLGHDFILAQNVIPMTVAPARQQINADPGSVEYFNLKFINQGTSPLYGNLKIVDFVVGDNQGNPVLLDDANLSTRFSAAGWVSLPQEKASIPPGGILSLQLKMTIPKDARPGGRYLAVSFEPTGTIPEATGVDQEGILGISSRLAGLVYVRVNGPITEQAFIENFKAPSFIQWGPVPVSFNILNRGDYHITPQGAVTLTNWFGTKVDEEILEAKNIFPDVSRSYESALGGRFLIGRYKVSVVAAYGESGQVLKQVAYVWAFPVLLFLLIALGIVILILSGVLISRKFTKKERELEEKLEVELSEVEKMKENLRDKVSSSTSSSPQDKAGKK